MPDALWPDWRHDKAKPHATVPSDGFQVGDVVRLRVGSSRPLTVVSVLPGGIVEVRDGERRRFGVPIVALRAVPIVAAA